MTIDGFTYSANRARVLFGPGKLHSLEEEIARLGLRRVVVLSTPAQREMATALAERIGPACVATFCEAAMHTPVGVTEAAVASVREAGADGVVAVGGGSTIGLGKAIALRTGLPQIAVPTTYAGSEMTPILGETKDGVKTTQSTPKVLPDVVIYDVDLTLGLPAALSFTSGVNAIAHAVEALYARDRNPIVRLMAMEGVEALWRGLPAIVADPLDAGARSDALYGAWLCGTLLGAVGMAVHHKLCHVLGGGFDLPHAETHTALLPHALAFNAPCVPEAIADLCAVLGDADPAGALYRMTGEMGAVRALRDLGMPEAGIDETVERTLANPYWNPRALEREALRRCVARAWAGDAPRSE